MSRPGPQPEAIASGGFPREFRDFSRDFFKNLRPFITNDLAGVLAWFLGPFSRFSEEVDGEAPGA